MTYILKPFMYIALIGFFASLAAHIAGYIGIERPFGVDPWPLHIGIFFVWLPAVIVSQRLSKDFPQKDMWKAVLRGCPTWMGRGVFCIFGYAMLSFLAFMATGAGSGGEANTIRGFSGHWLAFYSAAFAILYSAIQVSKNDTVHRCSNGHPVLLKDQYCSQCGAHVGSLLE